MIPVVTAEAWTAIAGMFGAVSAVLVALIRQHQSLIRTQKDSRDENTAQHMQSYGLLQSIDNRTILMHEKLDDHGHKLDEHGFRIDALEQRVLAHLLESVSDLEK